MTAAEELLNDVRAFVTKYVWFSSDYHAVVVALWIAHTWTVNAFYTTPRLILDSAEPGSGKTRVLELLALLCHSAKLTLSTTTAALYRRIAAAADDDRSPPTVLQDESDAIFGKSTNPQTEDLRALYNAGYKRGATVDRCEGDAKNMRVREFPVFAPVALAGLAGKMPDTITTRAVTLHMRRRRPGDYVAEYRERDAKLHATPLSDRLELWASQTNDELANARPAMPDGVRDRAAEVWEPLLAIADHAGGHWPESAREACHHFVVDHAGEDEKMSLGQRLLRDLKALLEAEEVTAMWSSDIVSKLVSDPESEWRDLWGKALDQRRLAKELNRYGVRSKDIRFGPAKNKGYAIEGLNGLGQAWAHWLTPSLSATSETTATLQVDVSRTVADESAAATSATHPRHPNTASEQQLFGNVAAVAAVAARNGISDTSTRKEPRVCPTCERAPARSDSVLCDFCTVKKRRQQTPPSQPELSCSQWLKQHIDGLRAQGHATVTAGAVLDCGEAVGYRRGAVSTAATKNPDITVIDRSAEATVWSIVPGHAPAHVSAPEWVDSYLDQLPPDADIVDREHFYAAAAAAKHSQVAARNALSASGRVDSIPPPSGSQSRRDRIWRIRRGQVVMKADAPEVR